MIVVTNESIPGKRVKEVVAVVRGASVRAIAISGDLLSVLRNVVGGELEEYTKMGAEAREQAYDRMVAQAESLDANAIIGMRFATVSMMPGAAEMICYGTAVVVEDE
ncbi:MAG: YbjQ family protein [Planctomycetota bacterium]|jgi:uncharacterized protein YbjQ (UPF0145 family)